MIPVGWIVLFSYKKRKLRFGFLLRDALLVIELGFKLSVSNAKEVLSPSPPPTLFLFRGGVLGLPGLTV